MSLVVIIGLLVNRQGRLPGLPAFAVLGLHRYLSLLSITFITVHIATAVLDSFVNISVAAAVIPFVSAYEPLWLGLGAVAFDLMIAIIVTSLLRAHIGRRTWRAVHWLAYALVAGRGRAQHLLEPGHAARPAPRRGPGLHRSRS